MGKSSENNLYMRNKLNSRFYGNYFTNISHLIPNKTPDSTNDPNQKKISPERKVFKRVSKLVKGALANNIPLKNSKFHSLTPTPAQKRYEPSPIVIKELKNNGQSIRLFT